jgi:CubicO group peptidase (beta-lactamase class C family)
MPDTQALERLLRERQAERMPSVAAAVVQNGEQVWANAVGAADYDEGRDATPDTQYRIGSITKTFTATAIMQLRDEGALDLDDRLEQHVEGIANGTPTIRRMLCHLSGLQREAGEMFVTGESPTEQELIASMSEVEFVLGPAQSHHYSNLAFALLGQVVAQKSGLSYTQYVDESIIRPLGLTRTTWTPHQPKAQGYLVDEYARTVWKEPDTDLAGTAAAGQLWSTVEDLGRWATFLARGADGVLAEKTNEEMWFPQVMYFPHDWVLGWGLGLMLHNHEGTIYGGHGGAMAGPPRGGLRRPQDEDRRRRPYERGHRSRHGPARDHARREGEGALAFADRALAAGAAAARRRPGHPRPMVVRGEGVRLLVGGRHVEGQGGRHAARARRDDVRARRRRLACRCRARAGRAAARRRRPLDLVRVRVHAGPGAVRCLTTRGSTPPRPRRRRRTAGRLPTDVSGRRG